MTRKSSSTPRTVATANIDRMVVDELSATRKLWCKSSPLELFPQSPSSEPSRGCRTTVASASLPVASMRLINGLF